MKFGELKGKFMGIDFISIYVDTEVGVEHIFVRNLTDEFDNYNVSIVTYDTIDNQLLISLTSDN